MHAPFCRLTTTARSSGDSMASSGVVTIGEPSLVGRRSALPDDQRVARLQGRRAPNELCGSSRLAARLVDEDLVAAGGF
jgi:hypothetical protein